MPKVSKKTIAYLLTGLIVFANTGQLFLGGVQKVNSADFSVFSVRPSRMTTSVTDVNFLVKFSPVTTATEASVRVDFGTGYTVDETASNITTSETGMTNWDSACTAGPTVSGNTASGVSGNSVTFSTADLTVGTTYCFIITAGIDNPASAGNYSVTVATETSVPADIDSYGISLPVVDDDTVVINAQVLPFVRCDVDTTDGTDNSINLGALNYGSVKSSNSLVTPDNIRVYGGTNAPGGMIWYYRAETNNGLYSTSQTALLTGSDSERTLSGLNTSCSATTPCFGIYYSGSSSSNTGTFVGDTAFAGGTPTTDVGPMVTNIYGSTIGTSNSAPASQVQADFYVNATASETSPVASDYTSTLIFTCKADL